MTERWVINASPLILLGKAGQLEWVPALGQVVVPSAVAMEIAAGSATDPARLFLAGDEGKALIQPDVTVSDELMAWDLGAGETSVIAWALAHPGFEAVLDDAAARTCAGVFAIRLRGTLSLVALAKRRGFIPACRPVFEKLRHAGLFITPALIEQVAQAVGE